MYGKADIDRLRKLAACWMEIASLPVMQTRKKEWRAVKDLKPDKPVILIDTGEINDFISNDELECSDPFLRSVEKYLLQNILQHEEVNDDIVIEPYLQVGWHLEVPSYGVEPEKRTAQDLKGRNLGYKIEHPIKKAEDLHKLKKRSVHINKESTFAYKSRLEDMFGDILPVKLGNAVIYDSSNGFKQYLGVNFIYVTFEILSLIGNDNLLMWCYDYPEELMQLSEFIIDDKIEIYKLLEKEKLMISNTDNHWAGPGSYGYCSWLPPADFSKPAKLMNCWCRAECQESEGISPKMFKDIFLPSIARACNIFGLTYYGCCERIDDRFEYIKNEIENLRAVSVSPWNDYRKMAEHMGNDYVYSAKPNTTALSFKNIDWEQLEDEVLALGKAASNCSLEILVRDLMTTENDRKRLKRWVEMVKKVVSC